MEAFLVLGGTRPLTSVTGFGNPREKLELLRGPGRHEIDVFASNAQIEGLLEICWELKMLELDHWLERFQSLATSHPGPIPDSIALPRAAPGAISGGGPHIAVGTCVHGVETGSLPGVVEFVEECLQDKLPTKARWTFVLGNLPAVKAGKRYLDADLNRQFDFSAPDKPNVWEKKRAREMAKVLSSASFFLDFHQTNLPVEEPFYIFGYHEQSYLWARALQGAALLVTRDARLPFSTGSLCADEFVRASHSPAITLELGEKGLNAPAAELSLKVLRNLKRLEYALLEDRALIEASGNCPELSFVQTVHKEPFENQKLMPGLQNLMWIKKGTEVGRVADGSLFLFPVDGRILFPKYPYRNADGTLAEPLAGDVFHIVTPMTAHPRSLFS